MSPRSNIFWAIICLTLILQGVVQADRLINNPDYGSGFYMFVSFLNAGFAVIASINISSAVRKFRSEPP